MALEDPSLYQSLQDELLGVSDTTSANPKPCWDRGSTSTPSLTRRHRIAEGWWCLPAHATNKPGVSHRGQPAARLLPGLCKEGRLSLSSSASTYSLTWEL